MGGNPGAGRVEARGVPVRSAVVLHGFVGYATIRSSGVGRAGVPLRFGDEMTASQRQSLARVTVLLVVVAQLADLASFGMVARLAGPEGELGPLGDVYAVGGFAPVAATKLLGLLAVMVIFALYTRRVGSPRRLALMVAGVGLLGALTNVAGLLSAASVTASRGVGL
jgi:hypothetical protein